MRINKFVAQATGLSRRAADTAIQQGRVTVNSAPVQIGQTLLHTDIVQLDGKDLKLFDKVTIMLSKPIGFVCSRDGQGSKTIYDLLPPQYQPLKPVGRLDKDSSGLLLLTNDGALANKLTHPSMQKDKKYQVTLSRELSHTDRQKIEGGLELSDGISKLKLNGSGKNWTVTMQEGRNRQIRRTFAALYYNINSLHRTHFGPYALNNLGFGEFTVAADG